MSVDTVQTNAVQATAAQSKRTDFHFLKLKEKLEKEGKAFNKSLLFFTETENELDKKKIADQAVSGRRRKAHSIKYFEFQGLPYKTISEDLNVIYEGMKEEDGFGPDDFRRNDRVSCIVDRKKYKGTVVSVNDRGMVVKTQDKRKIRIMWEDIEEGETKITKIDEDEKNY